MLIIDLDTIPTIEVNAIVCEILSHLADIFLIPHVLICPWKVIELKDFKIHHRLSLVGIDTGIHISEMIPAPD